MRGKRSPMPRRGFSGVTAFVGLTLIYFLAGKLGLKLAFLHASASPVWPPAGVALGALLVLGYRTWPAIFVGERMARAHFRDIARRMKFVAILVAPAQPCGQSIGDGAFTRTGDAHHHQRAGVFPITH